MAFVASLVPAVASSLSVPLGLGSGFWTALGVGATALSTLQAIRTNVQTAAAALADVEQKRQAALLDFQRRREDLRREVGREVARRTSLLSVSGGLVDAADLVLDGLLEGARAEERLATDLGFELGALRSRAANIRAGTRSANLGALLEGTARIASLLKEGR